jgi:hypothetical protein
MLEINFVGFEWRRPAVKRKGFAWQSLGDDLILVEVPGTEFKVYQPTEYPALFRNFAKLRTQDEILEFAGRYGTLVKGQWMVSTFALSDWQRCIAEMRRLIALVDFLHHDEHTAADLMGKKGEILRHAQYGYQTTVRPADLKTEDDVADAAAQPILRRFKDALECAQSKITWDSSAKRPRLSMIPDDLRYFLYWQLAQSFFRELTFHQCVVCGTWFQPMRPDCAKYCNLKCRLKHYRQQQKRARQLAAQGWSPTRIARELGSRIAAVKAWTNSKAARKRP